MNHHEEDAYDEDEGLDEDEDEDEGAYDAEEDDVPMVTTHVLTQQQLGSIVARAVEQPELRPLSEHEKTFNLNTTFQPAATCCLGPKQEALCMSLSQDRSLLAVGCANGKLLTFNPTTVELHQEYMLETDSMPCTAVRFRPDLPSSSTKNVLLVAKGSNVLHWHATTGTMLHTAAEEGNTIHAVKPRADGAMYATAGTDCTVRVYDEAERRVFCTLHEGDGVNTTGHSNNIYSIVWKPEDFQVLLTAGWDETVQIWDMRVGKSVRRIHGAYVCGDALDVKGQTVLTGSWRHRNPLQFWDFGSGKLITNLPYPQRQPDATLLYSAKYGQDTLTNSIFSCGSGKEPMARAHNKDGHLLGSMPLPSAGHAVEAGRWKDTSFINICCAFHIISWHLQSSQPAS